MDGQEIQEENQSVDNVFALAGDLADVGIDQDEVVADDAVVVAEAEQQIAAEEVAEGEAPKDSLEGIDGILAKDGKTIIPIAALQKERETNAKLRVELEEAKAKAGVEEGESQVNFEGLEELQTKLAGLQAKGTEAKDELGDDDLASGYQAAADMANALIAEKQKTARLEQAEASKAEAQMQESIDNHPAMSAWQADEGSKAWSTAVAIHESMLDQPDYAAKPVNEQFDSLAQAVATIMGIDIPGVESVQSDGADDAIALAKKDAARAAPKSLSEVPAQANNAAAESKPEDFMGLVGQFMDDPDSIDLKLAGL